MTTPQNATGPTAPSARRMVICSQMFVGVVVISIVPAMPEIARWHGANGVFYAQMLLVLPALSMIVGSPLAGRLGRLLGPRRLMLGCIGLYILAGMYGLVAPDSTSLAMSRLVLGLATALATALAMGLMGEFAPVSRARLIGIAGMLSGVAAVVGVAAGGWLTQAFGWRAGFMLFAWPLALLPSAYFGMPAQALALAEQTKPGPHPAWPALQAALPVYLLMFLTALMLFGPSLEGSFVLAARGLKNAAILGDLLAGLAAVSAAAGACYGWFAARRGERFQLQFLFLGYFVTSLLIAASRGIIPAAAGLVLSGIPCGLTMPILATRLSLRLREAQMTTGMGVLMSCLSLSQLSEPSILQWIKHVTPFSPFGLISLVCAAALTVISLGSLIRPPPPGKAIP